MILNRCEKNGYPIEVYCRRQFYGPIIIVYSGFHYPHRLRDFCLSDLNKIESINKTNSQKNTIRVHRSGAFIPLPGIDLNSDFNDTNSWKSDQTHDITETELKEKDKNERIRMQEANGVMNPEKINFDFTDEIMISRITKYLANDNYVRDNVAKLYEFFGVVESESLR